MKTHVVLLGIDIFEEDTLSAVKKSTQVARLGLAVLILGILTCAGCISMFLTHPQQSLWVVVGASVLIAAVGVELLCIRQAKRMFLRHYSRMGMSKHRTTNNDLIHAE